MKKSSAKAGGANKGSKLSARSAAYIAAAAVLICLCSWITVPFVVPFTMQTFAVFVSLLILGGKKGTAAIGLYLIMGMAGLPVFSGFRGGAGHILGPTGGYLIGFLLTGLCYMLFEGRADKRRAFEYCVLAAGMILCYISGTLWFTAVYARGGTSVGFFSALTMCVLPYILPDAVKLIMAVQIGRRIEKRIKNSGT